VTRPGRRAGRVTDLVGRVREACPDSGSSSGLDLDRMLAAAAVVERAVGHGLASNLYRAGGRAVPRMVG
jgi:hypothetical protein